MATEYEKKISGNDIIDKLNVKNAKIIAVCLVIVFFTFHGYRHLGYDVNSCTLIMNDGRYNGKKEWQPYGCMMHNYSEIDTKKCFRLTHFLGHYNHFIFIGDLRLFHLYAAFLKSINSKMTFKHNKTQSFSDGRLGLQVDYIYSPFLVVPFDINVTKWKSKKDYLSVLVLGYGVNNRLSMPGSLDSLQQFKENLTKLIPTFDRLVNNNVKVIWTLQEPIKIKSENVIKSNRLNNSVIDLYNNAAVEVLKISKIDILISNRKLSAPFLDDMTDGFMLPSEHIAKKTGAQILLNVYCNDHMNFQDGSCCSSAEHYTQLQIVTFMVLFLCLLLAAVGITHEKYKKWKKHTTLIVPAQSQSEFSIVSLALAKLALIMGYFYICDSSQVEEISNIKEVILYMRNVLTQETITIFYCITFFTITPLVKSLVLQLSKLYLSGKFGGLYSDNLVLILTNFFMKETKHFSHSAFWIPSVYLLCVGLFFTEDSGHSKILYRDQTNEWKGWMQLVLLIYHWTDAQRVLPLFLLSRVIISAYVFLSGYGHFHYFWQNGDGSFVRFFRVLFRLNFMQFVVCLCMNRPYQSYEFLPLISFWYVLVHVFMVLPPRITALSSENHPIQYLYLVFKFVFFFGIITALYMSEVFFEKIFVTRPWKALFVTSDDDITLWWRGWKRERYGVLCGMIFSVILLLAQRFNLLEDNNHSNLFSNGVSLFVTLVSLVGIGSYAAFAFLCRDWAECIEIHSYVAFIPIISYVVLRNISGVLRSRYSTFFAWFGKISLELCVGQFHIWLAADLNGTLVLFPKYSNVNVFLTSFIFVCAAHEIHEITNTLLPYVVPLNSYSLARNVLLFSAILIPIGIHAGMF